MPTLNYTTLGEIAEGTIGADVESRPRLDELTARISNGEFHTATNQTVVSGCIDGRRGGSPRPDAAGGTLSLAVADDLSTRKFGDAMTSTDELTRRVFRQLRESGNPVGDHTADEIHGETASGCGANDKLSQIYGIIVRKSDVLRHLTTMIGFAVTDDTHAQITQQARERTAFSTGVEVLAAMREQSPEDAIDMLHGQHGEVVAILNNRHGTTLDRYALAAEFGDDYEAFNIDIWAFDESVRALYPGADDETIWGAAAAMAYYNFATAIALCGPNMRVVSLD